MRLFWIVLALIVTSPACGQGVTQYQLTDASGKVWTSPDPVWLAQWVAQQGGPTVSAKPVDYGVERDHFPAIAGSASKTWGSASASEKAVKPDVFLTVVGATGPEADAVLKKWESDPGFESVRKSMGGRLAVHAYPRGHAVIKGLKIEADGSPDVLIQHADGREAARFYTDPGASELVSQIRKADPDYKPGEKDRLPFDFKFDPTVENVSAAALLTFCFVGVATFVVVLIGKRR